MESQSSEVQVFGFFIGKPSGQIHQKVKGVSGGKLYEQGTCLYVNPTNNATINTSELVAFTIADSEYSATTSKYVGIVHATKGQTAAVNGKIKIFDTAEVDIDAYEEKKAELIAKNGSTTMGLPFTTPNSKVYGYGSLQLTKSFK
jgi:hypothetical protein